MPIKLLSENKWLVQVQSGGVRRTARVQGPKSDAEKAERRLRKELEGAGEASARSVLAHAVQAPIPHQTRQARKRPASAIPTLREYLEQRWAAHAQVVQNRMTREKTRVPLNYLVHYLGDHTLDALLAPKVVHGFVEAMHRNGPIAFTMRSDGQPIKRRKTKLTHSSINKSLQCLKAVLNLAYVEGILDRRPQIDLLPLDDSMPIVACSEAEFQKLLHACEAFRPVAPWLPEAATLAAETGMRRGELFTLTWRSVDFQRRALRVEMQRHGRFVNGVAWRPKHGKFREIPISEKASVVLCALRDAGNGDEQALVVPSRGGAPYCRIDGAADAKGKGYFSDAAELAGLKDKVSFHGLRHLFAVRLLTRGVPITIVSELLGHSDINLTVKRYGRFASDAKVKWDAIGVL
jgi:integrase